MASDKQTGFQLFVRLLAQGQACWPHLVLLLVVSALATPLALLLPLPLAMVVDSLSGARPALLPDAAPSALIVFAVLFLVGLSLLDQLQKLGTNLLGTYIGERILLDFRARIFRHVQRLSLAYHDTIGTADSNYRIHWDAGAVQWITVFGLPPFVSAGFMLVGMIAVTAAINWQLALVALAVCPVLFAITFLSSRRLAADGKRPRDYESTAYNVVQEVLSGLRVVKAFGQKDREEGRFVTHSGEGMRQRVRLALLDGTFTLLFGMTVAVGTALVLLLGGRQVQNGELGLGDLVLVMGYLVQFYLPIQVISKSIATMQNALASAGRVFALLDENVDVVEKPDATRLRRADGILAFRNVSFAYGSAGQAADGEDLVLRDVSFDVPRGTRVGIAGATGAGKTTLVSLLSRFYDPTAGEILLDDVDLRDYHLADLRNQFSIVLQEPVLFSTTIAENIAYARPDASEADIIAAAKAANAHDFISNLPSGYQTLVGERGMRISGGERQRIALARAFLKDAPILILDEPTSSVDVKTEAGIMEAMQRLMKGRTAFMIAHRLTTLAQCDLRLEIQNGRVSRETPEDASLAQSGA